MKNKIIYRILLACALVAGAGAVFPRFHLADGFTGWCNVASARYAEIGFGYAKSGATECVRMGDTLVVSGKDGGEPSCLAFAGDDIFPMCLSLILLASAWMMFVKIDGERPEPKVCKLMMSGIL